MNKFILNKVQFDEVFSCSPLIYNHNTLVCLRCHLPFCDIDMFNFTLSEINQITVNLKVPCSNLAIKMAKQNSQVIRKLPNTIFTHPFHIKSSNEAYFSKYVLNCIDTHPSVYQSHTADIFKPAVGDPKQWRHDRAVRMPTMGISATCFPDPCHPKYRPVFFNQPLSVHIKFTPYSHD